jgi:ABC-type multidrug transport system permease subunit
MTAMEDLLVAAVPARSQSPTSSVKSLRAPAGRRRFINAAAKQRFPVLHESAKPLQLPPMKFALAILVFVLFAFFISWGVILVLHGQPWLLACALLVFIGTFIRYGCQSH